MHMQRRESDRHNQNGEERVAAAAAAGGVGDWQKRQINNQHRVPHHTAAGFAPSSLLRGR